MFTFSKERYMSRLAVIEETMVHLELLVFFLAKSFNFKSETVSDGVVFEYR